MFASLGGAIITHMGGLFVGNLHTVGESLLNLYLITFIFICVAFCAFLIGLKDEEINYDSTRQFVIYRGDLELTAVLLNEKFAPDYITCWCQDRLVVVNKHNFQIVTDRDLINLTTNLLEEINYGAGPSKL